jgi:hypothetical protein
MGFKHDQKVKAKVRILKKLLFPIKGGRIKEKENKREVISPMA